MYPIGSKSQECLSLNECLEEPHLLDIFQSILTESYPAFFQQHFTLVLVCRKWQQIADRQEIGRLIFKHLGWKFPQEKPEQWKREYRLQTGNFFLNCAQPQVRKITYAPVNLNYRRLEWIEDKGFIWFRHLEKEFHICLFDRPMEPKTIKTAEKIAALALHGDHLIYGMNDGTVVCFLFNNLEKPLFSHKAHKDALIGIFDYHDKWITISAAQIVIWDKATMQSELLLENYNPLASRTHYLGDVQCVNHYLFFYYGQINNQQIGSPYYYKLSLHDPHDGLKEISSRRGFGLRQIKPWGDQIGALFQKAIPVYEGEKQTHTRELFTVTRYPFDSQAIYLGKPENGEPTKSVTWEREIYKNPISCQFHFKGDAAFVVWQDDVETSIKLIGLKGKQTVLFERFEPVDSFMGTIAKNKFIYLKPKCNKAVILDFPLPS